MALRTKIGRPSGSVNSLQLPVKVWDDTGTSLDEATAVAQALAVIPASMFGGSSLPDVDISVKQEGRSAYEFSVPYTAPNLKELPRPEPPESGSLVRRVQCSTRPKRLTRFVQPIGVKDSTGSITGYYPDLKHEARRSGSEDELADNAEVTVDPLAESRTLDYYVPNTSLTDAWLDDIEDLVVRGAFNDDVFLGKPAATLQLVRFSAAERSRDDWELSFGFGYGPTRTDVVVNDDIIIDTLRACDYYYTVSRPAHVDGAKTMQARVVAAVVGQAWELDDFLKLQLPP